VNYMRTAARFVRGGKTTVRLALWFCACNMMTALLAAQCSNPTQVQNQTISSGTVNFTDNNALAASSVIINGSASVTFHTGNCIDLQPGFHATAGTAATTFHAWEDAGAPSITSLSVTSGTVGTAVTITGSDFGSSGTVTFNGTAATVTSWSAGSISVTVPVGAVPGSVNVVVTVNGVTSNAVAFNLQDSAPSNGTVTPSNGAGWHQTYTFTFSDPNGATDISSTQMDVGNSSGTANSCVVFFGRGSSFGYPDPSMGGFWLEDNAGQSWSGGGPVGQPGTLENSQCIVDAGASSLQLSGMNLTITVAASFKPGYAAAHTVWDMAQDNEGLSSGGYYGAGSYTVTTPPAPLFSLAAQQVTAQPIAPGSSASYTVTVTPQSGFSGVVKLENTALAAGETAAFTPASVSGGSGTATLTVNTDSQATPTGSINFSVIGMGQQGGGWVEAQTAATLDVEVLSPPPTVTLASPLNNASNQAITPALQWNAAARATSYDVFLYPASGTPTRVATVTVTTYTPSPALATNASYSWYVIAKNASGAAPASPTWTFTTVAASLTITSAHTGAFTQGQSNATYTLTVTNGASAGATNGAVAVTETAPSGLIPVSMQGAGWTCTGPTCLRSDALATGSSYPAITLTVDVANRAPASVTNTATVSGGGSANASASDATAIDALPRYSNPLAFAVPASVVAGVPTTFTVTYASQAGSGDIASGQVQIDSCYRRGRRAVPAMSRTFRTFRGQATQPLSVRRQTAGRPVYQSAYGVPSSPILSEPLRTSKMPGSDWLTLCVASSMMIFQV
jgi:hypothetical protein